MGEAFALQKLLTIFRQKYCQISDINVWNFNETLTIDVVSLNNRTLVYTETNPGWLELV